MLEELSEMILHTDFFSSGCQSRNAAKTPITVTMQPEASTIASTTVYFLKWHSTIRMVIK